MENETATISSDKKINLTIKEFLAVCMFLISLGISIGGFIKVIGDVKDVSTKVDNVSKDITDLKVQNAKLETLVKGKISIGEK
jgi:hypothetical protein